MIQNVDLWPHNEIVVDLWHHKWLWHMSHHQMCNFPIIVCGSVAGCGLDEKHGATHDAIFLMKKEPQARVMLKWNFDLFMYISLVPTFMQSAVS